MPSPALQKRFWKYVEKTDACWNWTAKKYSNGYGSLMHRKKYRLAHRVSWEMANGEIPVGMFVCHRCDNRACVRPDHLFLGTCEDNVADMLSKGRHVPPRGEKCGMSKLKDEDVRSIRRMRESGIGARDIASVFGVTPSQVWRIAARKRWAHLGLTEER